jgi:hypothetical protein
MFFFVDFNLSQSSVYTGHLDVVSEVEAVVKVLLALSKEAEMLSHDPCEVWRKVDPCYQVIIDQCHRIKMHRRLQ